MFMCRWVSSDFSEDNVDTKTCVREVYLDDTGRKQIVMEYCIRLSSSRRTVLTD